jgi:oligopeptidase B
MKKAVIPALMCLAFGLTAKSQNNMSKKQVYWPDVKPPVAEQKQHLHKAHGDVRIDPYYWMNDFFKKGPDSTKVVEYLQAENNYYSALMADTEKFQEVLYTEMRSRIKEQDESVPYLKNGYYYYTRQVEGKDYYLFCRKKGSLEAKEEVLLDVNKMAEGHNYFSVSGISVSPDNKWIAYGVDKVSRRQYQIFIKNIDTEMILEDVITNTEGDPTWANDNQTIFYTAKHPVTLLSERIMRHKMGTNENVDVEVYKETDPANYIGVGKSKSDKYLFIYSQQTLSTEMRYLDANTPDQPFKIFQPRMKEVLYSVDHAGDLFYIRTNLDAKNFRIMTATEDKTQAKDWKEFVMHYPDVFIGGMQVFKDFMAISERKDGLTRIHIIRFENNIGHYLSFDEPAYLASLAYNPGYDTDVLRFNYTSLTTPASVYDYNMNNKTKVLLKQQVVVGDFDPNRYVTERIFATATDGTKIPMSVVYRKGFKKDGTRPLLLYGYGSYGANMDATFSSVRLSLLDRGFAFAIAHIRGGQEMGRYWYEDGKMMKKKNTFTDFIDCAKYLVQEKYTTPEHLYAMGGSAGGLLMGAVVNMAPEMFNGIVAQVPFVDVVTTMSDPTIPLTTNEYDEWGNPENKEHYFYMKSYSPYDNVEKKSYPHMLITTGLHDSQVQYFEPAKWVARLRAYKTDNNKILFHTDLEAGHGGASGRFKSLKDRAREYAFILKLEGITQ